MARRAIGCPMGVQDDGEDPYREDPLQLYLQKCTWLTIG